MRILITNDDGIDAQGLKILVRVTEDYFGARLAPGEELAIAVCAPLGQCSAMSHRITITRPLEAFPREWESGSGSVQAWAVDGTPGDCVKAALGNLLEEKPDLVFSGINNGYNVGQDILYSGTVGAAMEGLIQGIPAAAFSIGRLSPDFEIVREFFPVVMDLAQERYPGVISAGPGGAHILNVNFPEEWDREGWAAVRDMQDLIAWDCVPAKNDYFCIDTYRGEKSETGSTLLHPVSGGIRPGAPGTDILAVQSGKIAVGLIRNMIL